MNKLHQKGGHAVRQAQPSVEHAILEGKVDLHQKANMLRTASRTALHSCMQVSLIFFDVTQLTELERKKKASRLVQPPNARTRCIITIYSYVDFPGLKMLHQVVVRHW